MGTARLWETPVYCIASPPGLQTTAEAEKPGFDRCFPTAVSAPGCMPVLTQHFHAADTGFGSWSEPRDFLPAARVSLGVAAADTQLRSRSTLTRCRLGRLCSPDGKGGGHLQVQGPTCAPSGEHVLRQVPVLSIWWPLPFLVSGASGWTTREQPGPPLQQLLVRVS